MIFFQYPVFPWWAQTRTRVIFIEAILPSLTGLAFFYSDSEVFLVFVRRWHGGRLVESAASGQPRVFRSFLHKPLFISFLFVYSVGVCAHVDHTWSGTKGVSTRGGRAPVALPRASAGGGCGTGGRAQRGEEHAPRGCHEREAQDCGLPLHHARPEPR